MKNSEKLSSYKFLAKKIIDISSASRQTLSLIETMGNSTNYIVSNVRLNYSNIFTDQSEV